MDFRRHIKPPSLWERIRNFFRPPYRQKDLEAAPKHWRSNLNLQAAIELYDKIENSRLHKP